MSLTIGELCAGYGGLGMAVEEVFGARLAWVSEYEAAPSKILAHHWPHVPNLGDMTRMDWAAVEPVDIISGGTPCQDLSHAGKRAGMTEGTRSNLWVQMREAIATIRPRFVVWENVRGAYSAAADSDVEPCPGCVGDGPGVNLRALGRVLGDLSDLGYDAGWHGLTAASVGAPHGRFRVFVLAWDTRSPADTSGDEPERRGGRRHLGSTQAGHEGTGRERQRIRDAALDSGAAPADTDGLGCERCGCSRSGRHGSAHLSVAPADADDPGLEGRRPERGGATTSLPTDSRPAPHPQGDGRHEGRPESAGLVGGSDAAVGGHAPADTIGGGWDGRSHDPVGSPVEGAAVAGSCAGIGARDNPAAGGATGSDAPRAVLVEVDEVDGFARAHGIGDGVDIGSPCTGDEVEPDPAQRLSDASLDLDGGTVGSSGGNDGVSGHNVDSLSRPADVNSRPEIAWGKFEPAIRTWELVLGRPVPPPTVLSPRGSQRLSPRFVEWMMGLPAGHVTDVPGISRNDQLKALGNGVVPAQAAAALRHILAAIAQKEAA